MHSTSRALFAALTVVTTMSACHIADVEAIEQHMLRECFTTPLAPTCAMADGNDLQQRVVFERFAQRNVTRAETEACLLDVDCSDERLGEDASGVVDDLQACISADPGSEAREERRTTRDAVCLDECDFALLGCGDDDDDCDLLTVSSCFAEHEGCVDGCPDALE